MPEKRPYVAPRLTSEKIFLPPLASGTGHLGFSPFRHPPPKK
jgi:hypothetical protein